ncbi:MAG: GDP-mannose 4,6-dehydratase [Betaproteobacteria bacterium]|nr:GDP-mannose 4,6-dehydratase [Betaproteobacteria bacterium]
MPKTALITGVTGQDGALLARFLLEKGYTVHGIKRRASSFNTARVDELFEGPAGGKSFFLHYGDMTDATNLVRLVQQTQPDEIYNLAAQSHVKVSFDTPEYTANADALGALRLLEAMRILGIEKTARFYQASTSEMFGASPPPQNETTPFMPQSPYAAAKLYAHWIAVNYRAAYGMHVCGGILFNHESPLRGETFVSRKITRAVAAIAAGKMQTFALGNLDARRDWGHARDFVEGMWKIMQHETPEDFVLATGESHSVREFAEAAFAEADMILKWRGNGLEETGEDQNGNVRVRVSPQYFRPLEVHDLQGDAAKARRVLGWAPQIKFAELVKEMVAADMAFLEK